MENIMNQLNDTMKAKYLHLVKTKVFLLW